MSIPSPLARNLCRGSIYRTGKPAVEQTERRPALARRARRILFATAHSIVDFSSGASIATLEGLTAGGFKCQAYFSRPISISRPRSASRKSSMRCMSPIRTRVDPRVGDSRLRSGSLRSGTRTGACRHGLACRRLTNTIHGALDWTVIFRQCRGFWPANGELACRWSHRARSSTTAGPSTFGATLRIDHDRSRSRSGGSVIGGARMLSGQRNTRSLTTEARAKSGSLRRDGAVMSVGPITPPSRHNSLE